MEIAAVTLHPVLRYHPTMLLPKDTPEIPHTSIAPQQQGGFLIGFSSPWAEEGASCSPDPASEHGLMLPPKYSPLLWPAKGPTGAVCWGKDPTPSPRITEPIGVAVWQLLPCGKHLALWPQGLCRWQHPQEQSREFAPANSAGWWGGAAPALLTLHNAEEKMAMGTPSPLPASTWDYEGSAHCQGTLSTWESQSQSN